MVQQLGLCTSNEGNTGLIPGLVWYSQKNQTVNWRKRLQSIHNVIQRTGTCTPTAWFQVLPLFLTTDSSWASDFALPQWSVRWIKNIFCLLDCCVLKWVHISECSIGGSVVVVDSSSIKGFHISHENMINIAS